MIKNKLYLYGEGTFKVPADLHFGKYLLKRVWNEKERIAVINADTDQSITFGELAQQAVDIALSLARLGVKRGDPVGICSEKRLEFMPTVLGIFCAGATYAPADVTCGRATILHRMNIAKPTVMFCSPVAYKTHRETIKELPYVKKVIVYGEDVKYSDATSFDEFLTEHVEVDDFECTPVNGWEDIVCILYSSGTTGLPKGIPICHLTYMGHIMLSADQEYCHKKTVLNTREWYYTYGSVYSLSCLLSGATIIYSPRNEEPDLLAAIEKYKIQILQVAPATLTDFVKSSIIDNHDMSSVERIVASSTTCDGELMNAVHKRFPNLKAVHQIYGMSEGGAICRTELASKGTKLGSVGVPNVGLVLKIVDLETRKPLGPNERGEICWKLPGPFLGYVGSPASEYLDAEGFFPTGDIGYYDEDKYVFVVDRIKELIKFNSFQVAPAELEAVLLQHPTVRDAGVVGAPHPQYGQAPTGFVVLQPGVEITEKELIDYVDTQVSHRMRLAGGVRFVGTLPYTSAGKLDRKVLKQML